MTPNFIVLGWKTPKGRERADALAFNCANGLHRILSDDRLIVLASPALPHSAPLPGLMLLGSIHGGAADASVTRAIDKLEGLTRSAWGNYLAIASDADTVLAMVDPSGAGRAHLAADTDIILMTDGLSRRLMEAARLVVSVDIPLLAGCLMDPGAIVSAPLLQGVVPMIAGVAYSLCDDRRPAAIWTPAKQPSEQRRHSLRDAVDSATLGMIGGRTPLIELSGGLDSSIVAGTMTDLGMRPRAVNVELIGGDVDELRYARATADHCGITIDTIKVSDFPDLAGIMRVEQAPHPYIYGVDAVFSGAVGAAIDGGVDCVVTGQGGDAVFYQPATAYTTVDRWQSLGLGSGWQALLDDARRSATSIWNLLGAVASDRIRGTALPQDMLGAALLTDEALQESRRFMHPWYENAASEPPGRRLQLLMLANSQMFHSARALDEDRRLVHPLLAQPVIEAALAIPTWQLACGALDRGLARKIFADRLAPAVARRRTKGAAAGFYSRTALANLPLLRERLLDGALVKHGILDKKAMERTLREETLFYSLDYPALIFHASSEAWLSAWTT